MKESKIVLALRSLNAYEQNSFLKFVNSDYFNSNKSLFTLCKEYVDYIRSDSTYLLSKQIIWSWISTEKFDDKKLRYANSELLKLFEKFVLVESIERNKLYHQVQQYIELTKFEEQKLYNSKQTKTKKYLDNYLIQDSEYFLQKYFFEKKVYEMNVGSHSDQAKFVTNLNIINSSEALDNFYAIEKLKLYSNLLTWKRIYKTDIEIDYKDLVLKFCRRGATGSAYIDIMVAIIEMQMRSAQEYFYKYKNTLHEHLSNISPEHLKEIFEAGFNYCIAQTNKGNSAFQREAFELYKLSIEKGVIIVDGSISTPSFNNIVVFGLKEGHYDWAESFIHEYAEYLDDTERESTRSYSLARVEFYKKNFRKVISLLANVEFTSKVTTLNAKVIQLFSYYELQEEDALDSLINSFRVYLNREKSISTSLKTAYKNLLNYTKRISRVNPLDQKKIQKLKTEISESKNVASKNWLLEKIGAIEK